jgi:ATP-dependent Clp protease ATP-binding subunit ClpC
MQIEINSLYYNESQEKLQKKTIKEINNQVKPLEYIKNNENYLDQIEFFKKEQKPFEHSYQKKFDQEFLNLYTVDLTEKAKNGQLDTVIGRTDEIQKTIEILSRRRKNNPILLGEPGVGKTAIAEGLAQLIVQKRVPSLLKNKTIVSLNLAGLLAGTQFRGQFEEKLKTLMSVIKEKGDIIVFIDEIHTIVGAGKTAENSGDAAQILKPALARGEFQCIGATTNEEYRKYFKEDAALDRRFQAVKIDETTVEDSIIILREIKPSYELYHKVKYAESALNAAVNFSVQYIQDRFLPDKAIDLLDEAGAYTRIQIDQKPNRMEELQMELERCIKVRNYYSKTTNLTKISETELNQLIKNVDETIDTINALLKEESKKVSENVKNNIVTAQTIATIIARSTGIPVDKISKAESEKLMDLEKLLDGKVIGQHDAVSTVAKAIKRARAGLRNSNRPIASFIFAGPTGVGKTELAKTLALNLFGSEKDIIRFDMSEYMEKHCVSKLIGSPPGYIGHSEGGQLTEAVRLKPYSIVLFDEIEKAHPDIFNLFLQLLDEGRLTDSKGKTVDFKNTLIILTSNIGASMIEHFSKKLMISDKIKNIEEVAEIKKNVSDSVNQQLKRYFKPEFLNRLDDIIIFQSLTKADLWDIAYLMIYDLIDEMEQKGIILNVSESVYKKIVKKGYNPAYGARPLRRAITTLLEDNLAEVLIGQELIPGMVVNVNTDSSDNIKVTICPPVEDDNFFYY